MLCRHLAILKKQPMHLHRQIPKGALGTVPEDTEDNSAILAKTGNDQALRQPPAGHSPRLATAPTVPRAHTTPYHCPPSLQRSFLYSFPHCLSKLCFPQPRTGTTRLTACCLPSPRPTSDLPMPNPTNTPRPSSPWTILPASAD